MTITTLKGSCGRLAATWRCSAISWTFRHMAMLPRFFFFYYWIVSSSISSSSSSSSSYHYCYYYCYSCRVSAICYQNWGGQQCNSLKYKLYLNHFRFSWQRGLQVVRLLESQLQLDGLASIVLEWFWDGMNVTWHLTLDVKRVLRTTFWVRSSFMHMCPSNHVLHHQQGPLFSNRPLRNGARHHLPSRGSWGKACNEATKQELRVRTKASIQHIVLYLHQPVHQRLITKDPSAMIAYQTAGGLGLVATTTPWDSPTTDLDWRLANWSLGGLRWSSWWQS